MASVDAVIHAATLHKPHVATHSRQDFVDTNITGTLNLLEKAFVFTSTTSVFGRALQPPPDAPAAWITEDVVPVPRNIYGVTKAAAEDLCELFSHRNGLPVVVLRTSRFFPEKDDSKAMRDGYADANVKANEFLFRRVDIADAVDAHLLALDRAAAIGFGRYIISATTPFDPEDLAELRSNTPAVVKRRCPAYETVYRERGWHMFPGIDRVYVNASARTVLGWQPAFDFATVIGRLATGEDMQSPLARTIGAKGLPCGDLCRRPLPDRIGRQSARFRKRRAINRSARARRSSSQARVRSWLSLSSRAQTHSARRNRPLRPISSSWPRRPPASSSAASRNQWMVRDRLKTIGTQWCGCEG